MHICVIPRDHIINSVYSVENIAKNRILYHKLFDMRFSFVSIFTFYPGVYLGQGIPYG